jgi:hypothetical protein
MGDNFTVVSSVLVKFADTRPICRDVIVIRILNING